MTIDIKQDLYGWGRSYQGQLGLRKQVLVQWVPVKIPIMQDPRMSDEDQPTRFANVCCGEKHSLFLNTNGTIWWTGHLNSVGKTDPNDLRKFKFEKVDDRLSY